jgi:iron complex transport system permease protein
MPYIDKHHYFRIRFILIAVLLVLIMVYAATLGSANITFSDSLKIILSRIPLIGSLINTSGIDERYFTIVLQIRLPRILLSSLAGAGLSVVGATFQGIFRNSMADPYVLGISSGAALGAALSIVLGMDKSVFGLGGIVIPAFLGAVITTLAVFMIARTGGRIPAATLLLAGVAVSFFLSSVISLLMIFNRNQIDRIIFWTMGSFSAAGWNQVLLLLIADAAGISVISVFSRDLNAMAAGDETAKSLGIDVESVKKILLGVSSLQVAACVSVSGIIGFVGLIVPHAIRLLTGSDNRVVLPFSLLGGVLFLLICDTLSRTMTSGEIPVGAITALFGAPYFIFLLKTAKKKV